MKELQKLKRFTKKLVDKQNINPGCSITMEMIECCLMEAKISLKELGGIEELRKIIQLHPGLRDHISF